MASDCRCRLQEADALAVATVALVGLKLWAGWLARRDLERYLIRVEEARLKARGDAFRVATARPI